MRLRRLPPVQSPIGARALFAAGAGAAAGVGDVTLYDAVRAFLVTHFGADAVALTDSGTSALVLALRLAVPAGGTVALPGYGCLDLAAAAIRAGVRVRLYDLEPATLSADLESLRRAAERGVDAIVVTHLFGYAADLAGACAIARAVGARVIEDAAQHAGGRVGGRPLGAGGPLAVLSFGRGKGVTGGRGGALLARTGGEPASATEAVRHWAASQATSPAGWGDLARAAAQWAFGRPALYWLPASIPQLRLGETVYRPAGEPGGLSRAAAAIVARAFSGLEAARDRRARRARWYDEHLTGAPMLRLVQPRDDTSPGYLRFPVLDDASRAPRPDLGIVRNYPRPLLEEPALADVVHPGEPDTPGAREIAQRLLTLPTHDDVREPDARRIADWVSRRRHH